METSRKFKLKKQIRTYLTLAWSMFGFFVFFVLTIMLANPIFGNPLGVILANEFNITTDNQAFLLVMIVLLVTPLFIGMMFTMLSTGCRQELYSYKNGIRLYRTRKFAMQIINLIESGNLEGAIVVYSKFDLGYDRKLDDYIYGLLLGCCKFSGDATREKTFERKINDIKEKYSPDKVIL